MRPLFSSLILGFVLMGQFASAQDTSYKMNVKMKDGSVYSVPINNVDQIYFTVINETAPEVNPVAEEIWNSPNAVKQVLGNCYTKCAQFEAFQQRLEALRTNPATVHSITPSTTLINDTYTAAYAAINIVNTFIAKVSSAKLDGTFTNSDEIDVFLSEARCLRAFIYYNLAMLWGNVILVTEPMNDNSSALAQSTQETVYQYVYAEMCDVITKLPETFGNAMENKVRFTSNAALLLKAEVELALGDKIAAAVSLNNVSTDAYFGFYIDAQTILPIYTTNILQLYKQEALNNTNDLETAWASITESKYGYWAALKRLGNPQNVTGCYDFELLMPFYYSTIAMNQAMVQNIGYN